MVAVGGAEVQAGDGGDAGFQQQALREAGAVGAEVADVGVDVEGAVGLDGDLQAKALEFGQQVVAALLEGCLLYTSRCV